MHVEKLRIDIWFEANKYLFLFENEKTPNCTRKMTTPNETPPQDGIQREDVLLREVTKISCKLEKITTVIQREEIASYDGTEEDENDESSTEEEEYKENKEKLKKLRIKANSPEWDNKSPTILARTLVREMFTEQERTNATPKNLDFWRLQWINEVVMDRFSIPKAARKNLWAQCIVSVGQMIRPR